MAQILHNLSSVTLVYFENAANATGDGLDNGEDTVDANIVSDE